MPAETTQPRRALSIRRRWLIAAAVAIVAVLAVAVFLVPRYFYAAPAPFRSTVAAGNDFSCAVTTKSTVRCWGANDAGQLGDGTFSPHPEPVAVTGVTDAVAVTAGSGGHACALTGSGEVQCWGANDIGQLGDGTTTTSPVALRVQGLPGPALSVTAGRSHTCALVGGDVYCWGSNDAGELGTGTTTDSSQPQRVRGLPGSAVAVSAGTGFTCALTDRGRARCWGDNGDGQLGDGGTTASPLPLEVRVPDVRFDAITTGDTHACAISGGSAYCWGANDGGQLGIGTRKRTPDPHRVIALTDAQSISAGHARTCATTAGRGVLCWGDAGAENIDAPAPTPVRGLGVEYSRVAVGTFHACATSTDHAVKCWGANPSGQLGDGTLVDRLVPVAAG